MQQRQDTNRRIITLRELYPDRWVPLHSMNGVKDWQPKWFIPDFLYENGTNFLLGPGKLGKSYLRTYLVVAALAGATVFDEISAVRKPKNALLMIGERNRYLEGQRIYAVGNALGLSDDEVKALPITILDKSGHKLDTIRGQEALVRTVEADGFDLVMVDPMRAFHDRKENDSSDMAIVNNFLRVFCEISTPWVVHHEGKPSEAGGSFFARGRKRTVGERGRGSTDIGAAADCTVAMTKVSKTVRELEFEQNAGPEHDKLRIAFDGNLFRRTQSTLKEAVLYERERDPEISASEIARRQHFKKKDVCAMVNNLYGTKQKSQKS